MKTAAEMLVELTEAVEAYNNARGTYARKVSRPSYRAETLINVARNQMFLAMRRARSRLSHKDSLESAYNRLKKQRAGVAYDSEES